MLFGFPLTQIALVSDQKDSTSFQGGEVCVTIGMVRKPSIKRKCFAIHKSYKFGMPCHFSTFNACACSRLRSIDALFFEIVRALMMFVDFKIPRLHVHFLIKSQLICNDVCHCQWPCLALVVCNVRVSLFKNADASLWNVLLIIRFENQRPHVLEIAGFGGNIPLFETKHLSMFDGVVKSQQFDFLNYFPRGDDLALVSSVERVLSILTCYDLFRGVSFQNTKLFWVCIGM